MISLGSSCSAAAGAFGFEGDLHPLPVTLVEVVELVEVPEEPVLQGEPGVTFFAGDVGVGDGGRLAFFDRACGTPWRRRRCHRAPALRGSGTSLRQPGDVRGGRRVSAPWSAGRPRRRAAAPPTGCRARCRRRSAGTAPRRCRRAGRSLSQLGDRDVLLRQFFGGGRRGGEADLGRRLALEVVARFVRLRAVRRPRRQREQQRRDQDEQARAASRGPKYQRGAPPASAQARSPWSVRPLRRRRARPRGLRLLRLCRSGMNFSAMTKAIASAIAIP